MTRATPLNVEGIALLVTPRIGHHVAITGGRRSRRAHEDARALHAQDLPLLRGLYRPWRKNDAEKRDSWVSIFWSKFICLAVMYSDVFEGHGKNTWARSIVFAIVNSICQVNIRGKHSTQCSVSMYDVGVRYAIIAKVASNIFSDR